MISGNFLSQKLSLFQRKIKQPFFWKFFKKLKKINFDLAEKPKKVENLFKKMFKKSILDVNV